MRFLFFKTYPEIAPGVVISVPQKAENQNKLSTQEIVGITTGLTTRNIGQYFNKGRLITT